MLDPPIDQINSFFKYWNSLFERYTDLVTLKQSQGHLE